VRKKPKLDSSQRAAARPVRWSWVRSPRVWSGNGWLPSDKTVPKNDGKIHHAINGKIHYFDWAIFNSYVNLPEGSCFKKSWWIWWVLNQKTMGKPLENRDWIQMIMEISGMEPTKIQKILRDIIRRS